MKTRQSLIKNKFGNVVFSILVEQYTIP